jgi:hypothetical protein
MKIPKSKLNPDDIGKAILTAVRREDTGGNVRDVVIVQVTKPDADANWEVYDYIIDDFSALTSECRSRGVAAQVRLQTRFDASWPDDHL